MPILTQPATHFDIIVVGTGPVGLTAALTLAETGCQIAVVGPEQQPTGRHEDRRTAALFAGSIALLRNLEVWPDCQAASAPLQGIRMIDGRNAILKAPEVLFHARDAAMNEFGFNVPNHALTQALWHRVGEASDNITLIPTQAVTSIERLEQHTIITLSDGRGVTTALLVGADGRKSICRESAEITHKTWSYPQTAIACTFAHTRPHRNISTEFHHEHGPLTVVPMPGEASSLVWVTSPAETELLLDLDDGKFAEALEEKLNGLLGDIDTVHKRAAFPLSAMTADQFGIRGVALVGEAAHVIPPIGAQGLNLGLRDCAVLADCIAHARAKNVNIAAAEAMSAYDHARAFDIRSRTNAVDIFNRSLLTSFLPAHLARGVGLHALKSFAPLRRWMVREGLSPTGVAPNLMQHNGRETFKAVLQGIKNGAHAHKPGHSAQTPIHS